MPTQHPLKTSSKSKMWIDYSSEEENQHGENGEVVGRKLSQDEKCHMLVETKQEKLNTKEKDNLLLPVLSTSHQPVKSHLLEERKVMLGQLRQIKGNLVWVELYVDNSNNSQYLKQKIDLLRNSHSKEIVKVYPSRDNKNCFDLRVEYDLCEKWVVEGVDKKNLIKISLRKKIAQKQQPPKKYQRKYDDNRREEYRPVTKQQPQTIPAPKYQPKFTQKKSNYILQTNIEYVQKSVQTEEIEKKVEQSLKEKKKEQSKKDKGSKFYSKNPFEVLNDSD